MHRVRLPAQRHRTDLCQTLTPHLRKHRCNYNHQAEEALSLLYVEFSPADSHRGAFISQSEELKLRLIVEISTEREKHVVGFLQKVC